MFICYFNSNSILFVFVFDLRLFWNSSDFALLWVVFGWVWWVILKSSSNGDHLAAYLENELESWSESSDDVEVANHR